MMMYEKTEPTETGLDIAIMTEDGRVYAWTYSESAAKIIVDAINNFC